MRLRRWRVCAGVIAAVAAAAYPLSVCRAQTDTHSGVPASLYVPDRFERAVKHQSSAPYYLMVTVVNDTTGEQQIVCTDGTRLFDAVKIENKLGRSREDWDKVMRLILDNATHIYHFSNTEAWDLVKTSYSPQMLAALKKALRPLSTEALAERFNYKTHYAIKEDDLPPGFGVNDYGAAMAFILTERGLLAGRADAGNTLFVITPQMLAEDDKADRERAEQTRRKKVEGQTFATLLPGYASLTRRFKVSDADVGEAWPGFCFSTSVRPLSSQLVDVITWVVPVREKTRKAKYDWNQFIPMAAHVERLARQHPWLKVWKAAGPNRTIYAHMYGKNLFYEMDDDIKTDIRPTWKDARMRGKPYCQLVLHWRENGESASTTLYLPLPGSGENRSLIVRSRPPYHADTTVPGLHWLDRIVVRSFPRADPRQVTVVSPDGLWKVLTLPTRQ